MRYAEQQSHRKLGEAVWHDSGCSHLKLLMRFPHCLPICLLPPLVPILPEVALLLFVKQVEGATCRTYSVVSKDQLIPKGAGQDSQCIQPPAIRMFRRSEGVAIRHHLNVKCIW